MDLENSKYVYNFILIITSVTILHSCQINTRESENKGELQRQLHKEKSIDVKAMVVKKETFYNEILSNGILASTKKSKLVFNINENILKLSVKNGQNVKQGELLVKLNSFEQKLNVKKAKNQLLKAELELKNILLAHNPDISDTGKINPKVIETAKGRSGYNDALFALQEAKYNLEQTEIRSPFNGVMSDIQVKENNYTGSFDFFAFVVNNSVMELEFGVMESELKMIRLNMEVTITPYALPETKFKGRIVEINPRVDNNGMIKAKALIPNQKGLLIDGMNVDVIVKQQVSNQLVVPKEAVLLRQHRQMLFVLKKDSIAEWVYVKTGHENLTQYAVSEGLNEGDTVIFDNNFNLGHKVVVNAQILTK